MECVNYVNFGLIKIIPCFKCIFKLTFFIFYEFLWQTIGLKPIIPEQTNATVNILHENFSGRNIPIELRRCVSTYFFTINYYGKKYEKFDFQLVKWNSINRTPRHSYFIMKTEFQYISGGNVFDLSNGAGLETLFQHG